MAMATATPQTEFDINKGIKRRRQLVEEQQGLRAVGSDERRMRLSQVDLELAQIDEAIRKSREANRPKAEVLQDGIGQPMPSPSRSPSGYRTPFSGFGGMRMEGGEERFITPGGDLYQGSVSTAPAEALVPSAAETAQYQDEEFLRMDPGRVAEFKADLEQRARRYEAQTGENPQFMGPLRGSPNQQAFGAARGAMDSLQAQRERMVREREIQLTPSLFQAEEAAKTRESTAGRAELDRLSREKVAELRGKQVGRSADGQSKNDAAIFKAKLDVATNQDLTPEAREIAYKEIDRLAGATGGPSPETGIGGIGDQDSEVKKDMAAGATLVDISDDGTVTLDIEGQLFEYPLEGTPFNPAEEQSDEIVPQAGVPEPRDLATLIRQSQMNNPRLAKNREIAAQERLSLSRESKRNRERQELPPMYQEAINAQRLGGLKKELRLFGG